MTIRQVYEYALIECNKLKAPSILLEDYIYLFNKAIQQYINRVYNKCEYNQQSSDDLGFLQTTTIIPIINNIPEDPEIKNTPIKNNFNDKIWIVELPKDYLHLLNCIATFKKDNYKSPHCNGDGIVKEISSPCNRLTADLYAGIINNYYMKPSHKKPYYYLINSNSSNNNVTNPNMDKQIIDGEGYKPSINGTEINEYQFYDLKESGDRTSTQAAVQMEIHCGNTSWDLKEIYVTYIKSPMYVTMTQEQLLNPIDTTQVLEFPDYVCYEIINIYVKLLLENAGDPRLQTNIPVNTSIVAGGAGN